jgi:hypothetical protein
MSLYTGIPQATLLARLTAAQTALLDLSGGAHTVMVQMGDKRVQYTDAPDQIAALKRHIRELQAAVGLTDRVQGVTIAGGKGL